MPTKVLVWDFDGTLGHRLEGMWTAALLEVARAELPALSITADQLRPHLRSGFPWHTPAQCHGHLTSAEQWWDALDPVFEHAFLELAVEPSLAYRLARQVRHVYPDPQRWQLYEDTIPALERLSEAGWKHTILSNHVPELPIIVNYLGLAAHIDRTFSSAFIGYEKPHPEAFRTVLRAVQPVTTVWMIGDSFHVDVAGAEAVGIPAILVRRHHPQASRFYPDLTSLADPERES